MPKHTHLPGSVIAGCKPVVLAFFCLLANALAGATTTLYVNGGRAAGGTENGTSWATAYRKLSDALFVANSLAPSAVNQVEVWVAVGTYKPAPNPNNADPRAASFYLPSYTTVLGGFAGTETNPNQRVISFNGPVTLLSGDLGTPVAGGIPTTYSALQTWSPTLTNIGDPTADHGDPGFADNAYNVVNARGLGSTLDNVVVAGGNANFYDQDTENTDHVLAMTEPDMDPEAIPCRPQQALDSRVAGGGILVYRPPLTKANEEAEYLVRQTISLRLSHCLVVGNFARLGGGMMAAHVSVSVVGTQFRGNIADLQGGGFLALDVAAGVQDSAFDDNSAVISGAGVSIVGLATKRTLYPTVDRAEFDFIQKRGGISGIDTQQKGSMEVQLSNKALKSGIDMAKDPLGKDPGKLAKFRAGFAKFKSWFTPRQPPTGLSTPTSGTPEPPVKNGPMTQAEAKQAKIKGYASKASTGYSALSYAVKGIDFGLDMAEAIDPNTANDPVFKGFRAFTEGFNTYATPEGLANLLATKAVEAIEGQLGGPLQSRGTGAMYRRLNIEQFGPRSETIVFLNTKFTHNQTIAGAGAHVLYANTRFERCLFDSNTAENGPALLVSGLGIHIAYNSIFTHNSGETEGAISADHNVKLFLAHDTIAHNTTLGVGAVGVGPGSEVKILNSILWDNHDGNGDAGADVYVFTMDDLLLAPPEAFQPPPAALRFTQVGRLEIANSVVQGLANLKEGDDYPVPTVAAENPKMEEIDALDANFAKAEADSMHEYYFIYNVGEGIRPGTKTKYGNTDADPNIGSDVRPAAGGSAFYLGKASRTNNLSLKPLSAIDYERAPLVNSEGKTAAGALQTPAPQSRFYVTPGGAGAKDGTSWANASDDLKAAMAVSGAEVWVKGGYYYASKTGDRTESFALARDVRVYGGFAGTESDLTARDIAGHPTILSGKLSDITPGAQNTCNIFRNVNVSGATLLDGFTITGGRANGDSAVRVRGAAMYNNQGAPTVRNCLITDNLALEEGGAIYSEDKNGPIFENCRFLNNSSNKGGAIFSANTSMAITGCVFTGNTAVRGGGAISVLGVSNSGTDYATIRNSVFSGNTVTAVGETTGASDFFTARGGALESQVDQLTVESCTIADNVLTRQVARKEGGAGITSFGATSVTNSIIWGNRIVGIAPIDTTMYDRQVYVSYGSDRYVRYSDIEGWEPDSRPTAPDAHSFAIDPSFNAPGLGDYSLAAWSPLINRGTEVGDPSYPTTDVAGGTRVFGPAMDLGAFEYQGVPDARVGTVASTRDCGVTSGYILQFTAPGGAAVTSPQWFVNRKDGQGTVLLAADSKHSGVTTTQLTIRDVTPEMSGWTYTVLNPVGYRGTYTLPTVGRSRLYVKPGVLGLLDGSSWANAFWTIEAALAAAAKNDDPCVQIWVAAGTYSPGTTVGSSWSLHNGVSLLGGFAGTETLVTQRDVKANPTILSGEIGNTSLLKDNIRNLFYNYNNNHPGEIDRTAQLDGFVLRGAAEMAIRNIGVSPTIRNCVFEFNGGAIRGEAGTTALIEDCTFRKNTLTWYLNFESDSASLYRRCLFADNTGRAVFDAYRSHTVFDRCIFWNNSTAGDASAGLIADVGSSITVTQSIFWNNYYSTAPADQQISQASQLKADGGSIAISNSIIQGLSSFAGNGNSAYDPLFVDPWNGNFALGPRSPAIALGAGAIPFTGSAATTLQLTGAPRGMTACGLGGITEFAVTWGAGQAFTPVWQVEVAGNFVPVTTSGMTYALVNGTNTQTLQLTLVPGPAIRLRYVDTTSGYTSAPIPVQLSQPNILRVRAGASAAGADGLTWNTAFPTLEAAVALADSCTEIWMTSGTYTLTPGPYGYYDAPGSFSIFGGFSGTETQRSERGNGVVEIRGALDLSLNRPSTFDRLTFRGTVPDWPAVAVSGLATFNDCIFTHPVADPTKFAAAVTAYSGNVAFTNCTFADSTAGGVRVNGGLVAFTGSRFDGNRSSQGGGALIVGDSSATVRVDRCRFTDNTAGGDGGALSANGRTTITNSVFSGNRTATRFGGAVASFGELHFVNNTVFANYAGQGGGGLDVYSGTAEIANSLFWRNLDGSSYARTGAAGRTEAMQLAVDPSVPFSAVSVSRTVIQGLSFFANNGNLGTHPLWLDPENGDFRLAAQSPAIDAGLLAPLTAAGGATLDEGGAARSLGGGVDLGAREFSGTKLSVLSLANVPDSIATCNGRAASFVVDGASVSWERSASPTSGFTPVSNFAGHPTSFTNNVSTLTVTSPQRPADDGAYLRFTLGGYTSPAYRLTVNAAAVLRVKAGSSAPTPDGLTWSTAFPTLQAALAVADKCNDLWVAQGTYSPGGAALKPGVEIYGGFAGGESAITDRNPSFYQTILQGAPALTQAVDADRTAIVDGFTLRSTGPGSILELASATGALFRGCRFEGTAGGTAIMANASSPRFENCTFTAFAGGGTIRTIYSGAEFVGCTFEQNTGRLMQIETGSRVLLDDATVRQNTVATGEESLITVNSAGTALTLVRGSFTGNTGLTLVDAVDGAGVTAFGTSFIANSSTHVRHHILRLNGGLQRLAQVTVYGNTILDPSNPNDIGSALLLEGPATAEVVNSILFGNVGSAKATASLEKQQVTVVNPAALTLTSSIVQGYATLGGTGNSAADPFLNNPLAGDLSPAAFSPAAAGAATLPEWALAYVTGTNNSIGATQFTGTSQPPVSVTRRPGDVTVYERNPATFFVDVPTGTESGVTWEFSANGSSGWTTVTPDASRTITTTPGRSTLTVLNATDPGGFYRYLIPAQSFTSTPIALTVQARRVLRVSVGASGGGNGASWATAFNRLENALAAADSSAEIWVAQGTYTFTRALLPVGVEIYGGFAGNEATRTPPLPADKTVLRGPVLALSFPTDAIPTTLMSNLTFAAAPNGGTAVTLTNATLALTGVNFTGISARAIQARESTLALAGVSFTGNGWGSLALADSTGFISDCTFTGNAASAFQDVSLVNSTVTLAGSRFEGDLRGVALAAYNTTLRLERTVFTQNLNGAVSVGGDTNQFTAINVLLDRNRGTTGGAGLRIDGGTSALSHLTVFGNSGRGAGEGIGVFSGDVTLANSIVWGNYTTAADGSTLEAQQIQRALGTLTLDHVMVEGLTALTGPGLLEWDPAFVDRDAGNFHLADFSPALNAGSAAAIPAGVTTDLAGAPRTYGSAPDLGAYELQSAATATDVHIRTLPRSVAVCANGTAAYTAVVPGKGASIVWHSDDYDDVANSGLPNIVTTTADSSTITFNPVVSQSDPLQIWFTITGTGYVSPRVTLRTDYSRPIFVNASAAAGGDGLSWNTAFRTIEEAVAVSDSCSEIWVAGGTYHPAATISLTPGLRIRGSFDGTEETLSDKRIIGEDTVVMAPANAAIFNASDPAIGRNTLLEGLVLSGDTGTHALILSGPVSPTVSDCVVQFHGGFTAIQVATGNPLFRRVVFRSNYNYALYLNQAGSMEVENCRFDDNLLEQNLAAGAAIRVAAAGGTAIVRDSLFRGNYGSAIGVATGASLTVLRSRFFENSGDTGGALNGTGAMDVRHSLFVRNIARLGGAINVGSAAGTLTLVNATIADNHATQNGAGLNTFGAATVRNSIFWNNQSAELAATVEQQQLRANVGGGGGSITAQNSLIAGLTAYTGNGNVGYDPLFDATAPFDSYRLNLFSPAIDAGSAAGFGANDALDVQSTARIAGSAPDLGAVERADTIGHQALAFLTPLAGGLTGRCTASGALLTVTGDPATMAAVRWERFTGGNWVRIANDATFTYSSSGSTASLHIAGSSDYVSDVLVRAVVDGTGYVSDYRRVSQLEHPHLYVNAAAVAGGDGLSWNTAFRTIAEATAVAGECSDIWVAGGNYDLTATITVPASVSIIGGFAGNESNAAQRDPVANPVVIHSTVGATPLGFVVGAGPDTIIEDLTLSGSSQGASIRQASPTFRNVTFTDQTQYAAFVWYDDAMPLFDGCIFVGQNLVVSGGSPVPTLLGAIVSNSTFTSAGFTGTAATAVTVTGSHFADGSIQLQDSLDTRFENTKFERTRIVSVGAGQLRVTSSEFWDNDVADANLDGGAINAQAATTTIVNTIFRGNRARLGGAIQSLGNLTLRNVVMRDNRSTADGGALEVGGGQATIVNSTIAYNTAVGQGGGIHTVSAPVVLRNTIVWGNAGTLSSTETLEALQVWYPLSGTPPVTATHSVIEGLKRLAGNANTALDPLLENSGSALVLSPYSPVIDLGDDSFVVPDETDVRGEPRVTLAHVDPGAAEATVAQAQSSTLNTPVSYAGSATSGRHYAVTFNFDSDLETRLGALVWGWQLNTGSGWVDLVDGVDGKITLGDSYVDLLLYSVPDSYNGAQLRAVAWHSGTIVYTSVEDTIEVLPGRIARVAAGAAAGGDGTSWAAAYQSVNAALSAAASGSITEIWVAAGTYAGDGVLVPGVSLYGGFAGTESARTERDVAVNPVVISGGTNALSAGSVTQPMGNETVIDGLELAGAANGALVFQASPLFRNVTFRNNTAHGVTVSGATSSPRFEDCRFFDNAGTDGAGVNITSGGATIERGIIAGNTASGSGGGVTAAGTSLVIRNTLISGNRAGTFGGGLQLLGGAVTLRNVTVASNAAIGSDGLGGAGIWLDSATLDARNSILWGNRVTTAPTVEKAQFDRAAPTPAHTLRQMAIEGFSAYTGTGNSGNDPFFLSDPGAGAAPFTTGNFRAANCSLTVDAGDSSLVTGGDTDLAGNDRQYSAGTVDLGAYEAQSARSASIVINTQPVSPIGCPGTDVTLSVAATGTGLTYAWEFDSLDGQGFLPVVDDPLHDNVTSSTLTVHLVSSTQHNWLYRARLTNADGCRVVSNAVATRVSDTRFYVDASAAAGGNGRSWATAYQTVTAALADPLLTQCGSSEIWIAAGTYSDANGFNLHAGVSLLGGFPAGGGTRDITANPTILTSSGTVVINASGSVTGAVLDGVTVNVSAAYGLSLDSGANPTFRNVRLNATSTGLTLISTSNSSPVFDGLEFTGATLQRALDQAGGTVTIDRLMARGVSTASLVGVASGNLFLTNALITGCTFTDRLMNVGGTVEIRHATIAANASSHLFVTGSGTLSFFNSIIWGNTAPDITGSVFVNVPNAAFRYTDLQGNLPSGAVTEVRSNADPVFAAPLTAASAPTASGNYQLDPCSPFASAGNNNYAGFAVAGGPGVDVTGALRPFDGVVDLGAYELQAQVLAITQQPAATSASFSGYTFFHVMAPGATSYQWQRSRSGGAFGNLTDNADYSGATTATLTLLRPAPIMNGDLYRVVVSDGSCRTLNSNSAAFTFNSAGVTAITTGTGGLRLGRSGDTLTATVGGTLLPGSVNAGSVAILAGQTGVHFASASGSGSTLTITPDSIPRFSAGEQVWVTLLSSILQNPAVPIRPSVTGYRAAVTPVTGSAYGGTPETWPTSSAIGTLAAGDFNRDGAMDLIMSTADGISLWANNGSGGFLAPVAITTSTAAQLVVGDFNADTQLDFLAVGSDGVITTWFGNGNGGFTANASFGTAVQAVALGDLDGDGYADIYAARNGGDQVWLNLGNGTFNSAGSTLGSANGLAVALGDFNHDGALDAMVAIAGGNPALWINDGRGGFTAGTSPTSGAATGVVAGDLNGDGLIDVVFSHGDKAASSWVGDGAGGFSLAGAIGNLVHSLDLSSISDNTGGLDPLNYKTKLTDNNTGTYFHYDLGSVSIVMNVVSTVPVKEIAVYATNQDEGFATNFGYLPYQFTVSGIRADNSEVDLSYDDVAGTNYYRPSVATSNGFATLTLTNNTEVFPRMRINVNSRFGGQTIWLAEMRLRGMVGGTFGAASSGLELADFNGDGAQDIWLRGTNGVARRWNNSGTGTFTAAGDATVSSGAAFALADFSGFGAMDLVHAPASGTGLTLRRYRTSEATLAERTTQTFSAALFTAQLTAPHQPQFTGLHLLLEPASGTLHLNGMPVVAGDVIPVASLGQLTYTPAAGFYGLDEFTWVAQDASLSTLETVTTHLQVVYDSRLPRITAQSASQAYTTYSPLTLTVTAGGDPTLTYQWSRNGTPVSGATTNSLTIAANRPQDAGTYTVVVTNSFGSITSAPIMVTVQGAPAFTLVPTDTLSRAGQTVQFTAGAVGTAPITYVWYLGAVGDRSQPVGGNVTTFTTPVLALSTGFWVEATNTAGSASAAVTAEVDNLPPSFSGVPAPISVHTDAGLATATATWTAPTASDNVGVASLTTNHAPGDTFPIGATTVIYTATDTVGNVATASFTVTVTDNEAPVISGTPANRTVNTSPGLATGTTTWTAPTASDNVGVTSFTTNFASGSTFPLGTTTVTYTAKDAANNTTTASFTVTVVDNEAPVISGMPANRTINTSPGLATGTTTWTAPSATDNVGVASFTTNHASGSTFPVGTTTVTYTAKDAANNTTTASFTVTVVDNEAPVISGMPANRTVNTSLGLATGTTTWTAPTASDNVGVTSFTSNFASGATFPLGTTTVTYTAKDAANNTTTGSFTVTVVDNEAPVISNLPANRTVNTTAGLATGTTTWTAPTATDNVGVTSFTSNFASGATFPLGTTTVTYTAKDAANNTTTGSFTVTVVDNEAPVINGTPANRTVNTSAGLATGTTTWTAPTASDNVGVTSFTSNFSSGATFPVGTTTVTYTAKDAANNTTTASFTVTVVDNEAPVISGVPANLSVTTTGGASTATATWTAPTASDNVGVTSFTSDFASGATFPLGTTTVTYTAKDAANNTATASFTVTVSGPPSQTVTTTADSGAGSLRAALALVSGSSPYTIVFDPSLAGATIKLNTVGSQVFGATALRITGNVTIDGTAAPGLVLSIDTASPNRDMRHFSVAAGAELHLRNVSVINGTARGGAGGLGPTGGGGGAGMGGAIFNEGVLTADDVLFHLNIVYGGVGGSGGTFSQGQQNSAGGGPNGGTVPSGNGGFGGGGAGYLTGSGPGGVGGFGGGAAGADSGYGGSGGNGLGGSIFNRGGQVTLTNTTFGDTYAFGASAGLGTGGHDGTRGSGYGGCLYSYGGNVTLTHVVFNYGVSDQYAETAGWQLFLYGDATSGSPTLAINHTPVDAMNQQLAGGATLAITGTGATINGFTPAISGLPASQQLTAYTEIPFTLAAAGSPSVTLATGNSAVIPLSALQVLSGPSRLAVTPGANGSAIVTLSVTEGNVSVSQSITLTIGSPASFATWRAAHFTGAELANASLSGPNAVFGADGLSNLVKYALGLDPKVNVTTGLPTVTNNGTDWVYTYTRSKDATDLTYGVEMSTDLANWTAVGVTHELVSSTATTETWRGRVPTGTAANLFFRLKVTAP